MQTLHTRQALLDALTRMPAGQRLALVPTMGYLHDGHLQLMERARAENDLVVATIFVNPTQFAANEDLDAYPRDPAGDARKCRDAGVDILWAPPREEVYRDGHQTTVQVEHTAAHLCGRSRPTHFQGVATIVLKLFNLVRPQRAYFGEKDWQQLQVIRTLVADLDVPVEVIGVPTVRAPDGLALSSRNSYLSEDARARARCLSLGLRAAVDAWASGERDAARLRVCLNAPIAATPGAAIDYAEIVHPERVTPHVGEIDPACGAVAALAVRIDGTRLIDNARLDAPDERLLQSTAEAPSS